MRVLIVGAGVVGSNLAHQLSGESNDVVVVDRNPELINRISEKFDVIALAGDGTCPAVLREAGIERCQMVIAVTESDAVNMVVCASANRFGVDRKIARVRNKEFVEDAEDFYRESFHIDQLINPEGFIADSLSTMVDIPACVEATEFDGGEVLLAGFTVDQDVPLTRCTIQESRQAYHDIPFLIVAVSHRWRLIIPRGNDRVEAGDTVYVILPRKHLQSFVPLVTHDEVREDSRIVIVAGAPESLRLAQSLEASGHQVAVIESDPARARMASETLVDSPVYLGEPTDLELLREAGTAEADFFIAAAKEDESNLFTALLAKRKGAKRTVVFTREAEHLPVLRTIGLDVVINPRLATAGAILHLVRRGHILQAAKIGHSEAEALQFEVPEGAPVLGRALSRCSIPRDAILGAVHRGEEVVIPDGQTVLEVGDRVIVFTLPEAVGQLEKLFAGR